MDLTSLTLAELRDLDVKIAQQLKHREKADLSAAREQILKIAQDAGVSLSDLLKAGAKVKSGSKVPVKYRHPQDSSLEWTGRGRQPKWINEWQETGMGLGELKV